MQVKKRECFLHHDFFRVQVNCLNVKMIRSIKSFRTLSNEPVINNTKGISHILTQMSLTIFTNFKMPPLLIQEDRNLCTKTTHNKVIETAYMNKSSLF